LFGAMDQQKRLPLNRLLQLALDHLGGDGASRRPIRACAELRSPASDADAITTWTVTAIDQQGRASAIVIESDGKVGKTQPVQEPLGYEAFSLPLKLELDQAVTALRGAGEEGLFDQVEVVQRLYPGSTEPLYVFRNPSGSQVGIGAMSGRLVKDS
jgi:hypothetical protein